MTRNHIRTLRTEHCQLSLRQLACVLDVHYTSIWRWEHGKVAISPRNLLRLITVVMHTVRRTVDRGEQNG